jgi:tRNA G46 methylase TrmB
MNHPRSIFAAKLLEFTDIAFVDDAAFENRGRWGDFFRRRIGPTFDGRIIVDVGCSDAAYLACVAAKFPQVGFVGIDWKYKALHDGARRVSELDIRNVALLRGRAQDVLKLFGEKEVDEIWVFHPEPCAKEVELKNRLIAEPFLMDAHASLRDSNSTLSMKTDHPGYYQWVLGLFGMPQPEWSVTRARARDLMNQNDIPSRSNTILKHFAVAVHSVDFWNDRAALSHTAARCFAGEQTTFESRFVAKRRPIYYFEMRKK